MGVLGLLGTRYWHTKIVHFFRVITPTYHTVSPAKPTHRFKPHHSRFVLVRVQNAMLYNALSVGKKTPKTAPSRWDFVTLPEEA